MYICGLTPYDSAHIGHLRTYIAFDLLKRYLIRRGFKIYHIQNITDVEDKIIKRCRETGADPKKLTQDNHSEALEAFAKLGILPADDYPKVTTHIADIIKLIEKLIKRKHAYETLTGVYFDVSSFADYGKLSGQKQDEIIAGARVEVDESKQNAADFALWKKTKGDLIEFDSPWGCGRPGWHIECSALSVLYAKRTLDIHGGGRDLIFPHHENEIAQSEAASGEKYCNIWMHPGFLTVDGEKMSKSLGNFVTVTQALQKFHPNAIRFFFLQAHYRSPVDYNEDSIEAAEESVERIFNSIGLIAEVVDKKTASNHADKEFRKESDVQILAVYTQLENDLNAPEAIAALFNLLRLANSNLASPKPDLEQLARIHKEVKEMVWILGLIEESPASLKGKKDAIDALLKELDEMAKSENAEAGLNRVIELRAEARKKKDYTRSDLIRKRLGEMGIVLEDKADGVRWKIS